MGFETNRLVEAQTRFEFLCGKEGTKRTNFGNKMSDVVHQLRLSIVPAFRSQD
jgi:hypothetical protein